jgi:hypothetical protein
MRIGIVTTFINISIYISNLASNLPHQRQPLESELMRPSRQQAAQTERTIDKRCS